MEHSAGCVDLRDVTGISVVKDTSNHKTLDNYEQRDGSDYQKHGKKSERSFEVALAHGAPTVFEAHTPEDAKEWVEKLTSLKAYWNRRHRVE